MHRTRLAALLLLPAAVALAPGASAAPVAADRELTVESAKAVTWQGAAQAGANAYYFKVVGDPAPASVGPVSSGTCSSTEVQHRCDTTLLTFSNPVPASDADGKLTKSASIVLSDYGPVPDPATDLDLLVFELKADGTRGAEVARDGDQEDTGNERVSLSVRTTTEQPTVTYVVDVVYFASAGSGFTATARF